MAFRNEFIPLMSFCNEKKNVSLLWLIQNSKYHLETGNYQTADLEPLCL